MASWDAIVIGLGGVGSAAAYHLAHNGQHVLGIDQYPAVHALGSSHGQTRIIRQAYFEHSAYVPLLRRAYALWDELGERAGAQFLYRTGLVEFGPADGVVIPGVLRSARDHNLEVELLSVEEVNRRWPQMSAPPHLQAVIEREAGYLKVEECVAAQLKLAKQAGATLLHETPVIDWQADGAGVKVTTHSGIYRAARLILAAGPWTAQLFTDMRIPLQVTRKYQYWYQPQSTGFLQEDGFPCFFHETPAGYFYGFPAIDAEGVKVARHSGGVPIHQPTEVHPTDAADRQQVERYTAEYLPLLGNQLHRQVGCYYTLTPDEHFIVDLHPGHSQVVIVAGLSGHGFKFTSVLGEIACQLALNGQTVHDTKLFAIHARTSSHF